MFEFKAVSRNVVSFEAAQPGAQTIELLGVTGQTGGQVPCGGLLQCLGVEQLAQGDGRMQLAACERNA
jgi:hypothetical protein